MRIEATHLLDLAALGALAFTLALIIFINWAYRP